MLDALRLQIEWGADEALDDLPVDRMAAPLPASVAPAPAWGAAASPAFAAPAIRGGLPARAQAAADGANTLEALYRVMACFTECALVATATKMALADGNPEAGLVLVGEAPGAEEDVAGRPFVGPAGQLLDRMLASIGLTRRDLVVINMIPWRPPGGRAPAESEIQVCTPFLWRHLTLLRPRTIVTLGQIPARALTRRDDTLRRMRGRWQNVPVPGLPAEISTLPMWHPATLVRTPVAKKDAWTDLVALRRHLDSN